MDNLSLFKQNGPEPEAAEPEAPGNCCIGCIFYFEKHDACMRLEGQDWDFPEADTCEFWEDENG